MDVITYPLAMMDLLEKRFDEKVAIPWMSQYWHWSIYISALYLVLVYLGYQYMKDKEPFNLRTALCVWSACLSVFSLYAFIKIVDPAYKLIYFGGLQHAICDTRNYVGSSGGGIWAFLFPLSKLPELGDTVFIVLRKQKLSFLHCYHHVTVFMYCWFSYAYPISTGIWFGIVNYAVHAIMYAYFTVRASGRRPPRWVATSITIIQLSQMFVGIYLNYMGITSLLMNRACETTWFNITISIFFYATYAVLFGNFFYWSYIYKKAKIPSTKADGELTNVPATTNGHTNSSIPNGTAIRHR